MSSWPVLDRTCSYSVRGWFVVAMSAVRVYCVARVGVCLGGRVMALRRAQGVCAAGASVSYLRLAKSTTIA